MIYSTNFAKKCTLLSLVLLRSNIFTMDKKQQDTPQARADRQVQQQLQMARLTTQIHQGHHVLEEINEVMPAIVINGEDRHPHTIHQVLPVLLLNEKKNQQVDMKKINKK